MALNTMNKAIFIDKDGTLVENVPYNNNPANIRLLPKSGEGLRLFKQAGFKLVVVTNQAGIAKGLLTKKDVLISKRKIDALLKFYGVFLDGFYFCPHYVEGAVVEYAFQCFCRKPFPGMLYKAASELSIDLHQSYMIGDICTDIEAGKAAGCNTVFINNPFAKEKPDPDFFADNLFSAASAILDNLSTKNRSDIYATV